MGRIRQAKDGHYYSVKRSGRRYRTIQHGRGNDTTSSLAAAFLGMLIFAPFTFGLSLLVAIPLGIALLISVIVKAIRSK